MTPVPLSKIWRDKLIKKIEDANYRTLAQHCNIFDNLRKPTQQKIKFWACLASNWVKFCWRRYLYNNKKNYWKKKPKPKVPNWWRIWTKNSFNSMVKRTSRRIFQIHFRALRNWATRMKVELAKEKKCKCSTKEAKDQLLHLKMPLVPTRMHQISRMANLDLSNHNHAEQVMEVQIFKRFKNNLNQQILTTSGSKQTCRETALMMGWIKAEATNSKVKSWFRWFKTKEQWLAKWCSGLCKVMRTKSRVTRMLSKPRMNLPSQIKMSKNLRLSLLKPKIYNRNINKLKIANLIRVSKSNPEVNIHQAHP